MSPSKSEPVFYYPEVLNQPVAPGKPFIYRQGADLSPNLDKPEGFRIPSIYFSWALLAGSRTLHHHPDNDELLVVLSGEATVHLYGPGKPDSRFETVFEVSAGDVVLFPQGWVHSVIDKGGPEDPVKVLVVFNHQGFLSVEDSNKFELPNASETQHMGENA